MCVGSCACPGCLAGLGHGNWFQVVEMEQERKALAGSGWAGLGPGLCLRVFAEPEVGGGGVPIQGSRVFAQSSCLPPAAQSLREAIEIEVVAWAPLLRPAPPRSPDDGPAAPAPSGLPQVGQHPPCPRSMGMPSVCQRLVSGGQ